MSCYIGQQFYLKGRSEAIRKYGYERFIKDYKYDKFSKTENIYKCCDGYNSKYEDLNGKYFEVLDAVRNPKAKESELVYGSSYFLKLKEKSTNEILYFEYDSEFEHNFPFIVVGYFEKLKKLYIGNEYVLRGRNFINGKPEMYDIQTGKLIDYSAGTLWKCVDISIDEKYYELSLIIENSKKEQIDYGIYWALKDNYFSFTKQDASQYEQKFGADLWKQILAGNIKILRAINPGSSLVPDR